MKAQFKFGSAVASVIAGGVGLLALFGWVFNIPVARSLLPGKSPMAFNSSVGYILASLAAILLLWPRGRWWREALFHLCALILLVLGVLTFSQYVVGWDLGIDLLLHPQNPWNEPWSHRGRMAPTTSVNFTLLGAAFILLGGRRAAWIGQTFAAVVGLLGLITVLGTIYGIDDLHNFPPTSSVSAGSAVATLLLGVALLMATPDRGPMAIVSSRTLTGAMARRILPLVVVVPSLLGFVRIIGHSMGWYGIGVGSALLVAGNVVLFTALALYVLGSLRVVELEGASAQESMRHSEERYRTFIENSTEGIWRIEFDEPLPPGLPEDEQIRYAFEHAYLAECNVAVARQYGHERPEQIIGRPLKDFLLPDDPRNREFLLAFIRSNYRLTDAESIESDAQGVQNIFMNNLLGIRDDQGRLLRAWGSQRNISDRKIAEAALRHEREFLRQVIDATPSMVFVKDWNGRFVLANEAIAKVYGVRVEDVIGKTDADFSPRSDEVAAFLRDDREVMVTRRPKLIPEEPVTDAQGRQRWFSTIKVPLVEADGACSRVLGVATDITDRRFAEEALRSSNERLEEAIQVRTRALEDSYLKLRHSERMAFVGTLSAGIGHDIGNLLLPIRERLESLAHDDSLSETTRADLATTRTGLNYLTRLTSALRTLAADPEESHGPADVTDVAAWWHEAEPLLHSVLPRNVTLDWSPPPAGLAVRMGAAALTQVVFNLVQNAGDALADSPGGRVRISAELQDEAWARFVVADNGPGMTDLVRERCMDPFFTTKTRRVSTGMGLPLVHGLVTKAGGRIDLESGPGQGATFRLTIPAAASVPVGGPSRPLALVSITDRRTAGFVSALLASMGFEVSEKQPANGEAVLWVVAAGAAEPGLAEVFEFVHAEPGRRALVIGGEAPPAQRIEQVFHVPGRLDPLAIRRALQTIAGQFAVVQPEVMNGPSADQRAVR